MRDEEDEEHKKQVTFIAIVMFVSLTIGMMLGYGVGKEDGLKLGYGWGKVDADNWYARRASSNDALPFSLSGHEKITCFGGGKSWPARADGICYAADKP